MSKSIMVPLSQVQFPSACVVCMSPAPKQYQIQQIFTFGKSSYTVAVDVPMCDPHFAAASFKGTAERLTEILGIVAGGLAGILAAVLLFLRWEGDVHWFFKILGGALFGFGIFLLVWWMIAMVIAPHLATPESKEARNAVKITRFLPGEQMVRLDFKNEQMSDEMQKQYG
jgi:hypothetical protein